MTPLHRTYETLFGLLVVTGLRSSEVVALDDGDLDHQQATLLVRRTKFGKTRVVPVHVSTVQALAAYQRFRDRVVRQRPDDALFISERGVRITQGIAEYTFARVSAAIGVRPRHVHDTYWYLEAVPELLQLAMDRLTDAGKAGEP